MSFVYLVMWFTVLEEKVNASELQSGIWEFGIHLGSRAANKLVLVHSNIEHSGNFMKENKSRNQKCSKTHEYIK